MSAVTPSKQKQPTRLARQSSISSNFTGDYGQRTRREVANPVGGPTRKSTALDNNAGNRVAEIVATQSRQQHGASLVHPDLKVPLRSDSQNSRHASDASSATSIRSIKAKSLQPPALPASIDLDESLLGERRRALSATNSIRSLPRSPSSSVPRSAPMKNTRRMSTFGHGHTHATGLGARTVSPTDTRRMKRLSVMPPPALPVSRGSRTTSPSTASPVPVLQDIEVTKSMTTDTRRKSAVSAAHLVANSSSGPQQRLAHVPSTSRLPTPRAKPLESENDEDIPPVPPIPKGLAVEIEPPTYSVRKSSLTNQHNTPAKRSRQSVTGMGPGESTPKIDPETRRKRGLTMGPTIDSKNPASALRQKSLQPLRLPPLTLLPLSKPTVARVNALGVSSTEKDEPVTIKSGQRTPSTPLTASKATFSEMRKSSQPQPQQNLTRSTSSIQLPHSPSVSSMRASSSNSSSMPLSTAASRYGRSTISPFLSTSLPKPPPNPADLELHPFTNLKAAPRPNLHIASGTGRDKTKDDYKTTAPDISPSKTPETPSSGSSIRRKLSLSWKRSSSKASHLKDEKALDSYNQYENMPPPRLPNTISWPNTTPVEDARNIASTKAARQRGSMYGFQTNGHDRTKSDSWGTMGMSNFSKEDGSHDQSANHESTHLKTKKSTSILVASQRSLAGKSSTSSLRSRIDVSLESEDSLADEEMRKIAARRKGMEAAAAEVDALQSRADPKERISAHQALKTLSLNIYERGEIVDYKDIYFAGADHAKKISGDLSSSTGNYNFGYDDERGDYNIILGDHLAYRYEVIDVLGKGSFGQVVRCIDHRTGGLVAVKIIRNKKRFHQQALVEVNILQKLRDWDPQDRHGLVKFTHSFYFRGHLCISTELLGMNLYEFIKSNDFRGFSLRLIRRFTKQLLGSLILLKGHRVIHCDLKPENILLAHPLHSDIKMIDFGSSCLEHEKVYTYIQSRFYRSPEVILGMTYGLPIDMWSLGCILTELYTGYPIFPGENEQEQLACIMEVFGPPEKHLIEKSSRRKLFFDSFGKPRMIVSSKGRRRRPSSKTLQQAIKCDDDSFLDFLTKCLRWDPEKRLKPDEAIQHEFITGKKVPKQRALSALDSPGKRIGQYSHPRPLPEPPSHKIAPSTISAVPTVATSGIPGHGNSRIVSKRHSLIGPPLNPGGVKRSSNGVLGSNPTSQLPRGGGRAVSISTSKIEPSDGIGR